MTINEEVAAKAKKWMHWNCKNAEWEDEIANKICLALYCSDNYCDTQPNDCPMVKKIRDEILKPEIKKAIEEVDIFSGGIR